MTVENEWERELMEQMRPSNDLWRSMGRRTLAAEPAHSTQRPDGP